MSNFYLQKRDVKSGCRFDGFFWFLAWGKFFSIFAVLPLLCFFAGKLLRMSNTLRASPAFLRLIFISKSETSNRVAVSTVFFGFFCVGKFFLFFAVVAVALFLQGNFYVCLIRSELPRFFASNFYLQNGLARLVALRAIRAVLAPSV